MSLRNQLSELLSDLLPINPKEAVKGTELIRLLRLKLNGEYSDASLRYHFSVMSCDPSSPIAKVEKGQGYYRRGASMPELSRVQGIVSISQRNLDGLDDHNALDQAMLRLNKFRAIVQKYAETKGQFTFEFRESLSKEAPLGNLWKFPEMVMIDWEHGDFSENGLELDPAHLALKQTLGLPPYRLSSVRMRVDTSYDTFREDLFQAMSASLWANGGELYLADSIADENLDDLPHPSQITNAMDRETEALMSRVNIERISAGESRTHCGWESLEALRRDHPEINQLLAWLGGSLESGIVKPFNTER